MQSTHADNASSALPRLHAAIIMDGNGRWATARGLSRNDGHRQGMAAVRRVAEAAPQLGIGTLTLFAFSADNWRRPESEVEGLMVLMSIYLRGELDRLAAEGIRLQVIGRRDRLPRSLVMAIAAAEARTAAGKRLHLRIAVDYSGREAILRAAALLTRQPARAALTRAAFEQAISEADEGSEGATAVDLLIRTGGEQRLSDFLLWESAYAELVFTPRMWPDFDGGDLAAAVEAFRRRDRRFGGLGGLSGRGMAASLPDAPLSALAPAVAPLAATA